jgi:small-conductance mechanosensitive channel
VGVSYDSDTRNVERILLEVLRQAQADLPGIREDFEPRVRFSGFGDSSLDFAMVVRVRDFDAQFEVQSEIRHRVFERFREEGISIPFPIRTLEFKNPLEFKSPPPPAR